MTYRQLTPPRTKDALVSAAALLSAYGLLAIQALGLAKLSLDKGVVLGALPFMLIIALGLPTWLLVRYLRKQNIETGFTSLSKRGWHLLWQTPVTIIAAGAATAFVASILGMENGERSSTLTSAGESGQTLPILLVLLAYLLLGPFLEELVFRRILMGYFDTLMPAALSVLFSSLLFGLVHVFPPAILFTTFLGISCALITRWHGTLWAGFIVHMLNNLVVGLLVFGIAG